jgi:hypothetical protein
MKLFPSLVFRFLFVFILSALTGDFPAQKLSQDFFLERPSQPLPVKTT